MNREFHGLDTPQHARCDGNDEKVHQPGFREGGNHPGAPLDHQARYRRVQRGKLMCEIPQIDATVAVKTAIHNDGTCEFDRSKTFYRRLRAGNDQRFAIGPQIYPKEYKLVTL